MTALVFSVPDELVETIAERAAALLLERAGASESEPVWLTLQQAGDRLGCSADAVRMAANHGRFESRYIGRRRYVSRASVEGAK